MPCRRRFLSFLLLVVVSFIYPPLSSAVDLLFNGFKDEDLRLFANATLEPFPHHSHHHHQQQQRRRQVLSLTHEDAFSLGRALLPYPIPTKSSSRQVLPFAASFIFSLATVLTALPGHGLAFLFAPAPGTLGATSAQHLGLFNRSTDGDSSSRVLAVEFDVFRNEEFDDIDGNHVGVDVNSLTSVKSASAGYWPDDEAAFVGLTLNDGSNYQAWVDYAAGRLNVTIAPVSLGQKPRRPLISLELDLSDVFLDEMYVGFCASTGRLVERHRVLGWSFSNSNSSSSAGLITTNLPSFSSPASSKSNRRLAIILSVSTTAIAISFMGVLGLRVAVDRRRRNREKLGEEIIEEEWESEYWPHRIDYHQIVAATDGFSGSNLVGRGGYGTVYQGLLGGDPVAVKVFSQTNEEEAKHFAAEVCTLGRLKHRNLVRLRGWCRPRRPASGVMIIVYDFMKNGSLDQWIYGAKNPLDWGSRARVLREVAAAVLYLHEGWGEAVVLHRDIKASNVMLDGEMTGRLGDFGLARAQQSGRLLWTSRVVGTAGYLAPEVMRTGRATTATDVYAFGVLALELASGRMAAEEGRPPLVAWARDAVATNGELAAVEARTRGSEGFDEREAVRVVTVGLACTREAGPTRPAMRQVVRMLEAEEWYEVPEVVGGGRAEATSWLLDSSQRQPVETASVRPISISTSQSGSDIISYGC